MYRGTFAVVDTKAISHNVAALKTLLRPGIRMLVAVKANGYGHGAREVAEAALAAGATDLGVASIEEGVALRQQGIQAPILVFGATSPKAAVFAVQHDIAVTLTDDWSEQNVPEFVSPLRVHLKMDTGMSRLGFRDDEQIIRAARFFASRSDIHLEGLFTHLACADAESLTHASGQMERFQRVVSALADENLRPQVVHAANSAGILRRHDWHYDMVRAGISVYGYAPSRDFELAVNLQPALHLYSFITRVVTLNDGETVGYGASYTVKGQRVIATVPVGYADGYPRYLSNRGTVVIRGRKAPVVGRVCMDQLMIDVTEIEGVKPGDCVTLYGRCAPNSWRIANYEAKSDEALSTFLQQSFHAETSPVVVSLDDIADLGGTISYEVMCGLSQRVPRYYV